MLFTDFLVWWYGRGWLQRIAGVGVHMQSWAEYFSVGTLLQTLFQPWKRIITTTRPDQSIKVKESALVDNFVSRMIGFFVRVSVLVAAVVVLLIVFVLSTLFAIVWPAIPLSPLVVLVAGLVV